MNILYCNIGWMKYYNGITADDSIKDGGAYIKFNGHGGEVDNFTNNHNYYFGYVRGSINNRIDIQSHFNDVKIDDLGRKYKDNMLIVWIAHRRIIGFYYNAKVYEFLQPLLEKYASTRDFNKANIISQKAILIPEKERDFIINGIGQSNIWYGNDETNKLVLEYAGKIIMQQELEKYMTDTKEYGKPSEDAINHFLTSDLATQIIYRPTDLNNRDIEKYINNKWLELVRDEAVDSLKSTAPLFSGGYAFYYYLSKQSLTDRQSLRTAIEQYEPPEAYSIKSSLSNVFKQYNGVQIYRVSHIDGTYHYMVVQSNGDIRTYNENGVQFANTNDIELVKYLNKIQFKQEYLGIDINAFLNIPLNNISEFDLYTRCNSIENPTVINNQHVTVDEVSHSFSSDISNSSTSAYEADKSKESESSENSYNSFNSQTSNIADKARDLTPEAVDKIVDKFANSIVKGDRQDILQKLEEKIRQKQLEQLEIEKWQYKVEEYPGEFTSKDIYDDEVLTNALKILETSKRLLIIGSTGDGKTELAYFLAHELTNENIGANREGKAHFNRICLASARDGEKLYTSSNSNTVGILNKFVKHIEDANITEPCVFICNEVQATDIGYLIGESLWEGFNEPDATNILPSNLYLIFTGCKDRDFGIDTQVTQRIQTVEVGCIDGNSESKHSKIIEAFRDNNENIEKILELIERINSNENYSIISMRKFKSFINGKNNDLGVKEQDEECLSNDSRNALKELRDKYGKHSN